MDWNRIEGDWKRMKGSAKEQWGRLTDDDLAAINGYAKDRIKREIDDWATEARAGARKIANDADLSDELDAIRADVQNLTATLGDVAKRQAGRAQDTAVEAMNNAEAYIRQNPLQAVAIAGALGFVYGVFTRR